MSRLFKSKKNLGLPPGTIPEADVPSRKAVVTVFDYDEKNFHEKTVQDIEECFPYKDSTTVTWINVEGMDPQVIRDIDEHFGVHPLVLEDIFHAGQRPKIEDYEDYLFIVLKMIYVNPKLNEIVDEQISLILGKNYVISIQEKEGDVFDPIRQRIRDKKGHIRAMGPDYLAYALIDAVVDNYYAVLEKKGDEIESLDDEIVGDPRDGISRKIQVLKRDMIYLRKQIWPLREVTSGLQRNGSGLIQKQTGLYLRDLYDHTIQVMDTVESFRDMLSGMHDSYLSGISNKMNEVMKVLTIFAALFIPLTFLAGIYGMNFDHMPELHWKYGYFIVLGLMGFIAAGMIVYFRKKDWM